MISDCGKYRYQLWRKIPQPLRWIKTVTFVMLNPSIADAEIDDPTIRRCKAFSKANGFTDMYVVNLFAYRATDPKELAFVDDPHGPKNSQYTWDAINKSTTTILAWGAHPMAKKARQNFNNNGDFYCLGMTKDGSPRHPLYVKSDQPIIEWLGRPDESAK